MAYKTFANGFPLPASDLNNYLMNQSVIVFANSAARSAALPTPTEGMITYLEDTNLVEVYNGSAWADINDNTAAIPKSTVTAAEDLIVADGASSVTNLSVGSEGDVLTVSGGAVSWSAPAGGGKDWTVISTVSPTGVSSVDFTGLSGKDSYYLSVGALSGTANATLRIQVNNDTSSIYTYQGLKIIRQSTYVGDIFDPVNTTSSQIELGYVDDAGDTYRGGWELSGATGSNYKVFSHVVATGAYNVADGDQTTIYKGYINLAAAITSIKIYINNGTFDAGTVTLLGA